MEFCVFVETRRDTKYLRPCDCHSPNVSIDGSATLISPHKRVNLTAIGMGCFKFNGDTD